MYVGVTDTNWFEFLSELQPDEVNFWRPCQPKNVHIVREGDLFLFKLHSPDNFVVGGGFFLRHAILPLSMAWECFREKNGAPSIDRVQALIRKHRAEAELNPLIGCTILSEPFFFPRDQWIPIPNDWATNIVSGRTYETNDPIGLQLFNDIQARLKIGNTNGLSLGEDSPLYGKQYLQTARVGQGAFRVLVTDAYTRRCSITGERTLPVLEAAHIKPYAEHGPNRICNGLLLRSDLHVLFDKGYLTVTPEHCVKVSDRIREEFENGKDYYALNGQALKFLPKRIEDRPSQEFLTWHNTKIYA